MTRESLFLDDPAIARFKTKVDSSKGPDECWRWRGYCNSAGYGVFYVCKVGFYAHRVAYTIAKWEIPYGHVVMHMCNNTNCCNPGHLKVGTLADNNKHKVSCGRSSLRKKKKYVNLKREDVVMIKIRLRMGHSKFSIKQTYGCNVQTIYDIAKGKTWRDVQIPEDIKPTVHDPFLDE